jgi:hypothetical protein
MEKFMGYPNFKNNQLQFDLKKILNYEDWCYTDITTDFVEGSGFVLDIKDNSYFYTNEEDRDFDDKLITKMLEDKFEF